MRLYFTWAFLLTLLIVFRREPIMRQWVLVFMLLFFLLVLAAMIADATMQRFTQFLVLLPK